MQFCTLAEHLEQVREDVYHKQSLKGKNEACSGGWASAVY